MAIDTYIKLRAAIADTANRDDLSADVPVFEGTTIEGMIKRAVANSTVTIQRDLIARGGHKNMETVDATLSTAAGVEYLDFPADFAGVRTFLLTGDPLRVLEFVDPTTLWIQYAAAATGRPEKYTIVGARRAYLRPVPDSAYAARLVYAQALPALEEDSDTNWLLTGHPDIYVGAAMMELCLYLENDTRLAFWKAYYDLKLTQLMGDDRNTRWAAVPQKPNLQVALA
jgi:hypothetical protein